MSEVNRRRLRQARKAKGLTQEQLAELLSVSSTTVRHWEAGHRSPSKSNLTEMASLTGQEVGWFFGSDDGLMTQNLDLDQSPEPKTTRSRPEDSTEQRLLGMLEKQQALMTEQLLLAERQRSDIANLTEAIKVQQQAFLAEREWQQRLAGRQLDTIEELRAEVAELRSQVRKDRGGRNPGVPATAAPGAAG